MYILHIHYPEGHYLSASMSNNLNIPSIVCGPTEEMAESLRELHWNRRINVQYKFVEGRPVERDVEEISVGDLFRRIGFDYAARGPQEIYYVNSIEGLFDGISEL